MVQFLLDLGADATSFAGDGKTPLEVGFSGLGGVKVEATWNPTPYTTMFERDGWKWCFPTIFFM